jgi:uncharacterized protein (DUF1501 family)
MTTRRAFLKGGAVALFTAAMGGNPLFIARTAAATRSGGGRKVLVAIFQRGAMDGLMAVQPLGDRYLAEARPRLSMSGARAAGTSALIDLDGTFGLHPGFAALAPMFAAGHLAVVHGVGSPDATRSHFDAQDYMESGTPGNKGTSSGWLNRATGLLGHDAGPFAAVALTPALPRSLYGEVPAIAVADLNELGINARAGGKDDGLSLPGFEALYEQTTQSLLRGAGKESFEAVKMISSAGVASIGAEPGAVYPQAPFGKAMRQIAQLIKSDVGLEVAFAEIGGWDTHVQQGTDNGTFARRAEELSRSIAAFWIDIGKHQDDVVILTMTEFGRMVHENGSGGTDHGHASCLFVAGSGVKGGRVFGSVAPLAPEELYDGRDLPVTTDFRSVFTEVAGSHLGITDDEAMFPGWTGHRVSLMES